MNTIQQWESSIGKTDFNVGDNATGHASFYATAPSVLQVVGHGRTTSGENFGYLHESLDASDDDASASAGEGAADNGPDTGAASSRSDKRARTGSSPNTDDTNVTPDVHTALLKYKRKHGSTYSITYTERQPCSVGPNALSDTPFGIRLEAVQVKNGHSLLIHYYETAFGVKYRGRPPSQSDHAIVVASLSETVSAETRTKLRPHDVLLFIDKYLVNITDKKKLKYYLAKMRQPTLPFTLTFFRPGEGDVESLGKQPPANHLAQLSVYKKTVGKSLHSATVSDSRSSILERRLAELEALHIETAAELNALREHDKLTSEEDRNHITVNEGSDPKNEEELYIPPHIRYYPPTKIRRKSIRGLHEACNTVEQILRRRRLIEREADKIRAVVEEAQSRLVTKESQLREMDQQLHAPLEEIKSIEMEVNDKWKGMYLKLKTYYQLNGHSNVTDREDSKLAKWITRQRTCYANGQLTQPNPAIGLIKPYQRDLLDQLDFCYNPREVQFARNVTMLRAFKKEHGHCNVPMKYENIHLANFVQKWRREHRLYRGGRPSNMTQERFDMLQNVGFSWRDPSRSRMRSDAREETWDGFISQMADFKERYGHFMVNKVNKSKGKGDRFGRLEEWCSWVRKQYILYKQGHHSQLDESRVAQLKDMGFLLERSHAVGLANKRIKLEGQLTPNDPIFPETNES